VPTSELQLIVATSYGCHQQQQQNLLPLQRLQQLLLLLSLLLLHLHLPAVSAP
jgi:hypothetical protein